MCGSPFRCRLDGQEVFCEMFVAGHFHSSANWLHSLVTMKLSVQTLNKIFISLTKIFAVQYKLIPVNMIIPISTKVFCDIFSDSRNCFFVIQNINFQLSIIFLKKFICIRITHEEAHHLVRLGETISNNAYNGSVFNRFGRLVPHLHGRSVAGKRLYICRQHDCRYSPPVNAYCVIFCAWE